MDNNSYFTFCGGSDLKNTEITVSLTPDIAFRLEILSKQKGLSLLQYITLVLSEHAENEIPKNKNYFKKYFL